VKEKELVLIYGRIREGGGLDALRDAPEWGGGGGLARSNCDPMSHGGGLSSGLISYVMCDRPGAKRDGTTRCNLREVTAVGTSLVQLSHPARRSVAGYRRRCRMEALPIKSRTYATSPERSRSWRKQIYA
jgi:hypothetical protein